MAKDKNLKKTFYKDECPVCKTNFYFTDNDIKDIYEPIPAQNGIKKFFGINEGYDIYRYVRCPMCKSYLKLKFSIDGSIVDGELKY